MIRDLNIFRSMRRKYHSNPLLGYLNINSLRGDKFRLLRDLITNIPIEILCLDETKLTNDFNDALFFIEGYQFPPYRRDRSSCNTRNIGGGKMVFIKDGLINKRLLDFETKTAETICLELTIKNKKWFIMFAYRPESIDRKVFFEEVKISLDKAFSKYDHVVLLGDLNVDMDIPSTDTKGYLSNLCDLFGLSNLVKGKTCYKKDGGSSLDIILTNSKNYFQSTKIIETGLSDHHSLVVTCFKSSFKKLPPKIIKYRDKKKFKETDYLEDLRNIDYKEIDNAINSYDELTKRVSSTIDKHAPIKTKILRGNDSPFMTKELRKAIMNRSRFTNKYNKWKSRENFLNLENSRKIVKELTFSAKKDYFKKASEDGIITNKKFWKTMKPLMTNKGIFATNLITLEEDGELISDEKDLAEIFNNHYVNIVENTVGAKPSPMGNPEDAMADESTVKSIIEHYKSNPIILKIKENSLNETFTFPKISRK